MFPYLAPQILTSSSTTHSTNIRERRSEESSWPLLMLSFILSKIPAGRQAVSFMENPYGAAIEQLP